MRRRLLLLGVALLAGCAAPAPPAGASRPRIAVEPGTFDFGDVRLGTAVTRRFRISNVGGSPLEVRDVDADCGCLATTHGATLIAPGSATDLAVTFHADTEGAVTRTVTVETNDPEQPARAITLRATVVAPVRRAH